MDPHTGCLLDVIMSEQEAHTNQLKLYRDWKQFEDKPLENPCIQVPKKNYLEGREPIYNKAIRGQARLKKTFEGSHHLTVSEIEFGIGTNHNSAQATKKYQQNGSIYFLRMYRNNRIQNCTHKVNRQLWNGEEKGRCTCQGKNSVQLAIWDAIVLHDNARPYSSKKFENLFWICHCHIFGFLEDLEGRIE